MENKLIAEDIKKADLVIFAADIAIIERERFDGKIIFDHDSEIFITGAAKAMDQAIAYYEENK